MPYSNRKKWTMGATSILHRLCDEFEELLRKNVEKFLEMEKRDSVLEEDVKIALIDLHKRLASEEISLPSSRFTEKELFKSLEIIYNQQKQNDRKRK